MPPKPWCARRKARGGSAPGIGTTELCLTCGKSGRSRSSTGLRQSRKGLAKLCIAAQAAFPEAVAELRNWLMPPRYPGHLLRRLNESQLCRDFPEQAVDFLLLVTDDDPLLGRDLEKCLKQIRSTVPQLKDDQGFKRLVERLRISGGELD